MYPLRYNQIYKFSSNISIGSTIELVWHTRVPNILKDNLQAKIENATHPPTSYFVRVQELIDIARKSSGGKYQLRSYADFELTDFHANFVKLAISHLMENAFDTPEHLLGFLAIDFRLCLVMS